MILTNGDAEYEVGVKLGETDAYRIYLCTEVATGRRCMLQIATSLQYNGGLDRAAYVLRELRKTSDLFEKKHAEMGGEKPLSYERLFPEVVDSFAAAEHGGRRVNILTFSEVEDISKLVPLSNLASKDKLRVDLKSSAWIIGRLLKLLEFSHGEGIAVRTLGGGNVLLKPDTHFAIVFDWSSALTYPLKTGVPKDARKDDVKMAAQAVFAAAGGDLATGEYGYPEELDDDSRRYVQLLRRLASGREGSAGKAHGQLYTLLEELYGIKFHPFTTLPL